MLLVLPSVGALDALGFQEIEGPIAWLPELLLMGGMLAVVWIWRRDVGRDGRSMRRKSVVEVTHHLDVKKTGTKTLSITANSPKPKARPLGKAMIRSTMYPTHALGVPVRPGADHAHPQPVVATVIDYSLSCVQNVDVAITRIDPSSGAAESHHEEC